MNTLNSFSQTYSNISYINESSYLELESSNYGCWLFPFWTYNFMTLHDTMCTFLHHTWDPNTVFIVSKTKQNFSLYSPQSSLSTLIELDQLKTQKATMSDTTPGQSLLPSPNSYDCMLSSKIQKTKKLEDTHL